MFRSTRALLSAMLVLVVALTLAACGSDSKDGDATTTTGGGSTSSEVLPEAEALVPAELREKGEIVVAFDASAPPFEFIDRDGRTIIGIDPDLANAIFPMLGLEPKLTAATFDTIIPGLQSGKYDIGMSSMTDTKEREEVVDFVTYLSAGSQFFARTDSNLEIEDVLDTCGLKVAVQSGGYQRETIAKETGKCAGEGREPIEAVVFPSQNAANLALSSGRVDAAFADSPIGAYQVKLSGGRFELVGPVMDTEPFGIAVPKDSGELTEAIKLALEQLKEDGTYSELFEKWGIANSEIDTIEINGAVS